MKNFKNKVAVITGAGSGIGFALAQRCGKEGMKVVLADIDEKFLRKAERKMKRLEADFITVLTDVSVVNEIEELAKKTFEAYGAVHLLVNNAGIGNTKYTWNYTLKDWEYQLGVNLWGVINGVRIFIPFMLKQDEECHIINVSSIEGLLSGSGPGGAIYGVSKHGVISLSETLRTDLEMQNSKVKVSVVCPGFVNTRILFGDTHRPERYQNLSSEEREDTRGEDYVAKLGAKLGVNIENGLDQTKIISPDEAADRIFQAIEQDKFYILTHKDNVLRRLVKERFDEILNEFDN
ncbi:MAG: SDR family NAD(P)-dependent oxidoreductase [Candidatus Thorarchaeota archaeon]